MTAPTSSGTADAQVATATDEPRALADSALDPAPSLLLVAAPAPKSLLLAGESPPPVYTTRLPAAVSLHYDVRRGFLRGQGEIRWRPSGDRYELTLEAQIAGITLLKQASQGGIEATGLAPERFLDQRARRAAQAVNFQRDKGTIGFSGPSLEWPLLPGTQDRLGWMIQLAGIAAAHPELLVEGGRIAMVVVGSRGDAGVWSFRYVGREGVETRFGAVDAIKLVRDGRAVAETSAEVWLDPQHGYVPARATLKGGSGASEYDLLLQRIEPGR